MGAALLSDPDKIEAVSCELRDHVRIKGMFLILTLVFTSDPEDARDRSFHPGDV